MKERYQRSFFDRKDYVRILFLAKSDGILFRLSYSGEGSFFLKDGVLSRNVKKERKVSKPHKNGALMKFESTGNRKTFILRKVL